MDFPINGGGETFKQNVGTCNSENNIKNIPHSIRSRTVCVEPIDLDVVSICFIENH